MEALLTTLAVLVALYAALRGLRWLLTRECIDNEIRK